MAREIRTFTWCDPCLGADVQEEGEEHTVTVNEGKPLTLALCKAHWDALLEPLTDALAAYGVTSEGKRPKGRPAAVQPPLMDVTTRKGVTPAGNRHHVCLWCPLTYASRTGWNRHLRVVHGVDPRALGRTCPLCGVETSGPLGNHVVRHHREEAATDSAAFLVAREAGDVHGVYAEVVGLADRGMGAP